MRKGKQMITVHWLGTSSGTPTRERNVSCVVVEVAGHLLLLDAGEGAQIALRQRGFSLSAIEAVCVTHVHGDHSFGLPGLYGSIALSGQPLPTLVADARVHELLDAVTRVSTGEERPCPRVLLSDEQELREVYAFALQQGAERVEVTVQALALEHRVETHGFRVCARRVGRPRLDGAALAAAGVSPGPLWGRLQRGEDIELPDGRVLRAAELSLPPRVQEVSFAYVTDTVPCAAAVELARGADLVSHEATFLPEHQQLAAERGHSTVADAVADFEAAGATELVVTHVSARNTAEQVAAALGDLVGQGRARVAWDGMSLTVRADSQGAPPVPR